MERYIYVQTLCEVSVDTDNLFSGLLSKFCCNIQIGIHEAAF